MSFDLQIQQGDLTIGSNGDLGQVVDIDKLIQDILKILSTPLGANAFFSWYGSLLSTSAVGSAMDHQFIQTAVEQQIRSSLENLQNMQKQQMSQNQLVSPQEILAAIQSVNVKRSMIDPTYFSIIVNVINKAYQTVPAKLQISI